MTIAPDTQPRILDNPGGFVLQVQRATDQQAAAQALAAAVSDVHALHDELDDDDEHRGPHMVSEVVQCPTGPYVYIDAPGVDEELLHRYPELVAHRLAEAGQPQAVVAVPEPTERLEQLANSPLAVLLFAFTMPVSLAPATTLPPSWIERATAWLQQDSPEQAMMWGIGPWVVEFSVPAAAAAGLLLDFNRTASSCALVSGDEGAVRSVRLEFLRTPWLVLATAGPALDDPARAAAAEALQEHARELAPEAAYACIATAPALAAGIGGPGPPFQAPNRYVDADSFALVADELVLDAFWHQVLSPGHLRRLGRRPPGAASLPSGRVELTLGEARTWLAADDATQALQAAGRVTLASCLYDDELTWALVRQRLPGRQPRRPLGEPGPPPPS
jgi:hypothetical protein